MSYYNIVNKATSKVVNIKGSNITSLTSHQNVTLYSATGSNEQKWRIDTISASVSTFIRSYVDESFGLNVNRRQGADYYNCDVLAVSGNTTDASVVFISQGNGYYKIKLANYDAYLTATGTSDGSNIKWLASQSDDLQVWSLSEITASTEDTDEYHLISNAGNGDCLKVGSYYRITSNTTPSLDEFSYYNRQRWLIKGSGAYRRIYTKHGTNYILSKSGTSDVLVAYQPSGDDSYVTLVQYGAASQSLYRIKHTNSGLYLTASGTSVSWSALNSSNMLQVWKVSLDKNADIHNGVDVYSTNGNSATLNALVNGAEEFVGRYYTSLGTGKQLTASERDAIHARGLKIVSIYQDSNNEKSDFNAESGASNAASAYAHAINLGQPANTAIYFAVDGDINGDLSTSILPYFNAVKNYFAAQSVPYKVGVYGSGYVCNLVKQQYGYATYSFLAASSGWTGTASYDDPSKYNIKQGELITYNSLDFDDDTAIGSNYGQW